MRPELRSEYGGFAAGWTALAIVISGSAATKQSRRARVNLRGIAPSALGSRHAPRRDDAREGEAAMSGNIEARLKELGIELPQPTAPLANYVPFTVSGKVVFIAGQICQWIGERRFVGKLGAGISI